MTVKKQTRKTLMPREGGSVVIEPKVKQSENKEEGKTNAG